MSIVNEIFGCRATNGALLFFFYDLYLFLRLAHLLIVKTAIIKLTK